ncbi:alpha/beta hydrolase [uncultured Shewanella sp.]|uniref:alpha/beta fold hydrolase n=1 Tax=uncultured Shewanella sp. TaxID=173975 RepID=UPI00263951A2|nr:alpha/beta hydrolase [uncultured Shewanella sp.]
MPYGSYEDHYFITSDKARLHFLDRGEGPSLVMLPALGFSSQIFKYQLEQLSQKYRVLALDMRGHHLSQKVSYGYNIAHFARDLYEFIRHLKLVNVSLLGHNFGASVICSYLEQFGFSLLDKLIFIDRSAVPLINPLWTQKEIRNYGPTSNINSVKRLCSQIKSSHEDSFVKLFVDSNVALSNKATFEQRNLVIESSGALSHSNVSIILYDSFQQDWRSLFRKITIPTLLIGGIGSFIPYSSLIWASKQILNSKIFIFEEDEGGKHFPFIENAQYFNQIIDTFIQGHLR